ncbi:predicted protein [Paecilomyces variotii No. 5]|uniref:Uncharacterized protein n=1 Tax=Byssochlamys spectabilis (strain No. 5 / NBRC 109023) TaxID=1356009 RepID=V5FIC0_BYSSN|nr:predicted protein [Paecilomyces variotii No. 5]
MASSQNVDNVTVYEASQLDNQVSRQFLDCLKKTGIEYNFYVDEGGVTVVVPAERREIDFDGKDQELLKCIIAINDRMNVAAESTVEDDDKHKNAISSNSLTHEWLEEQGASGKSVVGTRPARTVLSSRFSGIASSSISGQELQNK